MVMARHKKLLWLPLAMVLIVPNASGMILLAHRTSGSTRQLSNYMEEIQNAIVLTRQSEKNPLRAFEALDKWGMILSNPKALPNKVVGLCYSLEAYCLVRVGRDQEAIRAYRDCLASLSSSSSSSGVLLEPSTVEECKMGIAFALQRLMRYEEANQQFLCCNNNERAIIGAATCCLRLGDAGAAMEALRRSSSTKPPSNEIRDMGKTLEFLSGPPETKTTMVLKDCTGSTPLYRWIRAVANRASSERQSRPPESTFDFLQLAAVNQSPFDDPELVVLDDKLRLHTLLTIGNVSCWPRGFILPQQLPEFQAVKDTGKGWILKSRAGYGSNGNQLVLDEKGVDAVQLDDDAMMGRESLLCQRLVDPSLLIQGRKFSLRVYVYYFLREAEAVSSSLFLSNKGLVKLASMPFREGSRDERMFMTNSGREESMLQHDFDFLKKELEAGGGSYPEFWSLLRQSIGQIMNQYDQHVSSTPPALRQQLAKLGLPKILGFDFMVSPDLKPVLLEVNRFPGLEPRCEADAAVKQTVVREAWICAATRLGMDIESIGILNDDTTMSMSSLNSFEQIHFSVKDTTCT